MYIRCYLSMSHLSFLIWTTSCSHVCSSVPSSLKAPLLFSSFLFSFFSFATFLTHQNQLEHTPPPWFRNHHCSFLGTKNPPHSCSLVFITSLCHLNPSHTSSLSHSLPGQTSTSLYSPPPAPCFLSCKKKIIIHLDSCLN